jgi:hypothetical protein
MNGVMTEMPPTITKTVKSPRGTARQGMLAPAPLAAASAEARRRAAAILEVLGGLRRPSEAAEMLKTSVPRYYQWERRALTGLLTACEPAARGRGPDLARRITALERENRRLQRECDRQRALVRAAERTLGLTAPAPAAKSKAGSPNDGAKKRRQRRPAVRALKAVRQLQMDRALDATNGAAVEGAASVVARDG